MALLRGIAAAGAARRMGFDKLTAEFAPGDSLMTRALAAGGAGAVVALPPQDHPYHAARAALAAGHGTCTTPGAALGCSIAALARVAQARGADGLMLLLCDMPEITAAHVAALESGFAQAPGRCLRACGPEGQAGHPVVFPARLLARLSMLDGAEGARAVLQAEPVATLPLPGRAAIRDIDTPRDWDRLRTGISAR